MRTVIQRVTQASVTISGQVKSSIGTGLLILLGIGKDDTEEDINWLVKKIIGLRIFDDEMGVMNRGIMDIKGEIIVVSQFTLMASYKKGTVQAGFTQPLMKSQYRSIITFCDALSEAMGKPIGTGEFGADMKVELLNDGPVTISMDTKNKE